MCDQVPVTELKPIVDATALSLSQDVKRVPVDAPATILRREASQGVHHRIEVGAHGEAPMSKVIPCIHDDGQ